MNSIRCILVISLTMAAVAVIGQAKLAVVEGDTVVMMPPRFIDNVNRMYVDYKNLQYDYGLISEAYQMCDLTLANTMGVADSIISRQNAIIDKLDGVVKYKDSQLESNQKINEILQDNNRKLTKRSKVLKVGVLAAFVAGIFIGGL